MTFSFLEKPIVTLSRNFSRVDHIIGCKTSWDRLYIGM